MSQILVQHLIKISRASSLAIEKLRVKDSPPEVASAYLYLFAAAKLTLKHGIKLLGLTPLERM